MHIKGADGRFIKEDPERRFYRFVRLPDENGCMNWLGTINPNGYGQFRIDQRLIPAHRFAYELWVGPIPAGLQLDHLCRNRHCVSPQHLEPVTQQENIRRGQGGCQSASKTHCPHGHPYDARNTYRYRGRRFCRACSRERKRDTNELRSAARGRR